MDKYLFVSFATSSEMLILNGTNGQQVSKSSGSGQIKGMQITTFDDEDEVGNGTDRLDEGYMYVIVDRC